MTTGLGYGLSPAPKWLREKDQVGAKVRLAVGLAV